MSQECNISHCTYLPLGRQEPTATTKIAKRLPRGHPGVADCFGAHFFTLDFNVPRRHVPIVFISFGRPRKP